MGNVIESVELPETPPDFPYFSVTFIGLDSLVMVNANEAVLTAIRKSIERCWKR